MLLIFWSSQAPSYGFHYAACLWHLCLFIQSAEHTHTPFYLSYTLYINLYIFVDKQQNSLRYLTIIGSQILCAHILRVHISFSFLKSFRHFIQLYFNRLYSKFRWKSFVCACVLVPSVDMLSQDVVKNHNKFLLEQVSLVQMRCTNVCVCKFQNRRDF